MFSLGPQCPFAGAAGGWERKFISCFKMAYIRPWMVPPLLVSGIIFATSSATGSTGMNAGCSHANGKCRKIVSGCSAATRTARVLQ
ncbi:potassium transporter [Anopheles sinensis]|uniref:Potassium transporter n=1 Tax=Anopheles sinensis TaxID=74873 RepID=A0A084W6Z7_ANOSI|nr:potassium transporter [Anopheles sinensis]